MKKKIFVDTGAFIALLDTDEPHHAVAKGLFKTYTGNSEYVLYTIDYVLTELFTLMRCRERYPVDAILKFIQNVEIAGIQLFGITMDVFQDALVLMKKYDDHYFSMTDCVSFVVMKDSKTKNVLTTDKHFSVAGFNNLLK